MTIEQVEREEEDEDEDSDPNYSETGATEEVEENVNEDRN